MVPPRERDAREEDRRERLKRALVEGFVGKKISVSTTDFHHLVGQLLALEPRPGDQLKILVKAREIHLRLGAVVRIHEADPALAEYIK